MIRLRHLVKIGPRPMLGRGLAADTEVTFAPMDALADGLGGLSISLTRPLGEVAAGSYNYFADGDLLLAKVTPCFENGKKALARELVNGIGFATSEVHVIRPDVRRIHPRYLLYVLSSEDFRAAGMASMTGAGGLRRVSEAAVLDFRPRITDLPTQIAIADFLDRETARIDQLIEKKKRLVELFPEKEKAMVSRLVLQGDRKHDEESDTDIEWRGTTPSHWKECRLKAHFRIQKRQGYDDLIVLSVYREYGVIEKSSRDDNINKTPLDLSKYQLVQPGDLVINKMKAWQGSLGISRFRGITSPDYLVMTPLAKHVSEYMHHLLRARPMPSVYQMISNGIRTDQWRMEPEKFLALPLFLPPIKEQSRIARKIEDELTRLRLIVEAVTNSIDRLREYRAALITAAVAGQIDVTSWSKRGNTDRHLDVTEREMVS